MWEFPILYHQLPHIHRSTFYRLQISNLPIIRSPGHSQAFSTIEQCRPCTPYSLGLSSLLHPASSATISAALSPIASTVNIGFAVVISGKTPASAILTPLSPLTLNFESTTTISSISRFPILVVPAGWYTVCATLRPYSERASSEVMLGPGATSRLSQDLKGSCFATSRAALRPATMVAAS